MTSPFLPVIPRRSQRCTQHQEVLAQGADYYSLIKEDDNGGFIRHDYCSACWESSAKQICLENSTSFWKSKVPIKQEVAPRSQNREICAFELLKLALSSNTPEDQADAFILALYLARKRYLHLRQQLQQEGQTVTIYEVVETEEMLGVRKMPLSQLQVVTLQIRLAEKLRMGVQET